MSSVARLHARRRFSTSVSLVAMALVVPALTVDAAVAGSYQVLIDLGDGWVHESARPLLDVQRMVPGTSVSSVIGVKNDSSYVSELSVRSIDIVDDDNGCNEPESLLDSTCGPGEGELGHQMIFKIYVDAAHDGKFPPVPTWSGTVYDLSTVRQLAKGIRPRAEWNLKLEVEFPASSGNETQSDQLGFGLQLILSSDAGTSSTEVLGSTVGREEVPTASMSTDVLADKDGPSTRPGIFGHLPFTGAPLAGFVVSATALLLLGTAALISRRRGATTTSR